METHSRKTGKGRLKNAIDRLDRGAFKSAAGVARERHVLFENSRRHQCEIQNRLFPQRRVRPRQANGTCRSRPTQELAETDTECRSTAAAEATRALAFRIQAANAGLRKYGTGQAPLRADRSAPSFAG